MTQRLTHPIFGIDSYGPTPTTLHHEIGSHFAYRYTSRQEGKAITGLEYQKNLDAGIGTVIVFEDGATNALMGYDQGKSDAEFAQRQCVAAGMEPTRPICFAVDAEVDPVKTDSYFAGVAAVKGKDASGPYGDYDVCANLAHQGFKWFNQTCAWSGGRIFELAQLYQYEINLTIQGHGIDYDHAYYEDYGQWGYKPTVVEPHDYQRFYAGPFFYRDTWIRERKLVEDYDKLRRHPRINAKKLAEIRRLLALDLERIASKASRHRVPGKLSPPEWSAFDRGERYQLIAKRVKGEVVK